MKNRSNILLLVLVILLQILLSSGMIIYKNTSADYVSENGEIFRFRLESISCTDEYIAFYVDNTPVWGAEYVSLKTGIDGFAELTAVKKKPDGNSYIKSNYAHSFRFPVEKIKTDEFDGIGMINLYSAEIYKDSVLSEFGAVLFEEAYLEAYVYKGDVIPAEIYVDGEPLKSELISSMSNS